MLVVFTGPMFSGKTESLIRQSSLADYAKQTKVFVKPVIDIRAGSDAVMSHSGWGRKAIEVEIDKTEWLPEANVYFFDEVQFLDQCWIDYIDFLAKQHEVYCTCLSQDFKGRPFKSAPNLLAIADKIYTLRAVCMDCHKKDSATKTFRISKEGDQVDVGGVDKYKSLCRECWEKAWKA